MAAGEFSGGLYYRGDADDKSRQMYAKKPNPTYPDPKAKHDCYYSVTIPLPLLPIGCQYD